MMNTRRIELVLRVGVFGEFFGHGVFALQGKEAWLGWIQELLPVGAETAGTLLTAVGLFDIAVALIVLFAPVPAVLLWAAFWGFFTALLRPIVGDPIWDFLERWANWAAPLALLLIMGMPKQPGAWFSPKRNG